MFFVKEFGSSEENDEGDDDTTNFSVGQVNSVDLADAADVQKSRQIQNPPNSF